MKKPFKTALSLFACSMMLLSGCGNNATSLPEGLKPGKSGDYPASLNMLSTSFFRTADAPDYEQVKQDWLDDMSARYGVNLDIQCDTIKNGEYVSRDKLEFMYDVLYGEKTFAGVVEVNGFNTLYYSVYNDVAVPLEEYLADNATWNALPEELKSMFELDGHIYAIPAAVTRTINARLVSNESLQQTGVTVSDLDTLKEYATVLSRFESFKGIPIGSDRLNQLVDVLNAYGLYVDSESDLPVTYDPAEDCITDYLTKDTAISALEYLRKLYAQGLLEVNFDRAVSAYKKFNTEKAYASFYTSYYDLEEYTEVLTLNRAYPQILDEYVKGYVMTKDTPQPKETINLLVDMLFGSEQNYFDCRFGSPEFYSQNSDGTLTVQLAKMPDGSYDTPPMPNLVGNLPGLFPYSDGNLYYNRDGAAYNSENTKKYYDLIDQALANETAITVPISLRFIRSTDYYLSQRDIYQLYTKCINDAITGVNTSVADIVEEYRIAMFDMGGNEILDAANAAIGKKTTYYYG